MLSGVTPVIEDDTAFLNEVIAVVLEVKSFAERPTD